ncbi:MAG TPA: hypothetical protein VN688_17935 [Gemmataceae bacterium]|nr:hypothetical protein [Gemmataceae bacterium]
MLLDFVETVADSPAGKVDWDATEVECKRLASFCRHSWSTTDVYYGGLTANVAGHVRREIARRAASKYKGSQNPVVQGWILNGERCRQADLLRDIFGNPFSPVSTNPTWLTPSVITLAPAAYEERPLPSGELDTARLAVLADALEEAGCHDTDILGHLRSPGPHVRGCWVLDALLGKS